MWACRGRGTFKPWIFVSSIPTLIHRYTDTSAFATHDLLRLYSTSLHFNHKHVHSQVAPRKHELAHNVYSLAENATLINVEYKQNNE